MDPHEIHKQIEKFDRTFVTGISTSINSYGHVGGTISVTCNGECNLPKDLLDQALSISQENKIEPINHIGQFAVVEYSPTDTTYDIEFPYNIRFFHSLKNAYEKEEWRKANNEMDAFIEKWLGQDKYNEDNGH